MARVGRLVWEKGYVAATDGNLSARLGSDRVLVTPSGVSKGFLSATGLVVIDLDGVPVGGQRGKGEKPSSEIQMHLEVYRQRPDVQAVIHAHPPLATAFSIAGVSLARCVIPEVIVALGGIPTTGYATPATPEVAESIRGTIREYDALIMAHHGSLTVGRSLWEAYMRLEKVEHAAQITLVAHQLGRVSTLSPEAVAKLATKRRDLLRREGRDLCADCTVCAMGDRSEAPATISPSRPDTRDEEALVRRIAETVVKSIEGGIGRG